MDSMQYKFCFSCRPIIGRRNFARFMTLRAQLLVTERAPDENLFLSSSIFPGRVVRRPKQLLLPITESPRWSLVLCRRTERCDSGFWMIASFRGDEITGCCRDDEILASVCRAFHFLARIAAMTMWWLSIANESAKIVDRDRAFGSIVPLRV